MSELVSVIMPVYNTAKYLEEAVDSVLTQEYSDLELLIANDGSTDGSAEILERYQKADSRVKVISFSENVGAAKARNALLEKAEGRFVAFLDSDDVWYRWKLTHQVRFMLRRNYSFTYSYYEAIDESSEYLKKFTRLPRVVEFNDILKWNDIGTLTVMVDKEVHGRIRMPEIVKRHDFALWLLLLSSKDTSAHLLPEITAQYRVHSESLSANKMSAASYHWKVIRKYGNLNPFSAMAYFLSYTLHGILRHFFIKRRISNPYLKTTKE